MDTRPTRSPKGEPLFRRTTAERPWRRCARSLLSLTLLLAFLHSIFLSAATPRQTTAAGNHPVVRVAHDAQTSADVPVAPGAGPVENAPDEEGDSNETAEPDKDFLADETTLPHFSRPLLKKLGYGEPAPGRFCSPLPGFSPPPERVA